MNRKDLKVENVQHYLYQNYFLFYICLHLEPEINPGRGFRFLHLHSLHSHCTTVNEYIISKMLLILQPNLNLKGFSPPEELYNFELIEKCYTIESEM